MYPKIIVDSNKIKYNTKMLVKKCNDINIKVSGVTKVFCADPIIARALVEGGVSALADSRIKNLKKLKDIRIEKWLLRLPSISEVEEVVEYADVSLNSELKVIKLLSNQAIKKGKKHDIILMVDLGDLREGMFDHDELMITVKEIKKLKGINVKGIGTNLTCYGGIIPKQNILNNLVNIKNEVEEILDTKIEILSGGNSSSLHLIDKNELPKEINQLRLGESLVLGRETAYGNRIEDTYDDAFILETEIIELKTKPSVPIGEVGMDAFGNTPVFKDKGSMKRCICAIGRQDINIDGIVPLDNNIEIIGASSDHLLLDVTRVKHNLNLGDIIRFKLTYTGVLSAMTSDYVDKQINQVINFPHKYIV